MRRRRRGVNMKKMIVIVLLMCFEIVNSEAPFSTATPKLEGYVIRKELTDQLEVAAPAEEVWSLFSSPTFPELLQYLLPGAFEKMEVVKGDGGVGSILHLVFPPGQIPHEYWEKIVLIDNQQRLKEIRQIKGGYLDMGVTFYMDSFRVVSTGLKSCVVISSTVYDVKPEDEERMEQLITIESLTVITKAVAKFVEGGGISAI